MSCSLLSLLVLCFLIVVIPVQEDEDELIKAALCFIRYEKVYINQFEKLNGRMTEFEKNQSVDRAESEIFQIKLLDRIRVDRAELEVIQNKLLDRIRVGRAESEIFQNKLLDRIRVDRAELEANQNKLLDRIRVDIAELEVNQNKMLDKIRVEFQNAMLPMQRFHEWKNAAILLVTFCGSNLLQSKTVRGNLLYILLCFTYAFERIFRKNSEIFFESCGLVKIKRGVVLQHF